MRLWHIALISKLPQKQLCGQWRECIALLGNGWGKKHRTVNYVFNYPESYLIHYAYKVYDEMIRRDYKPNFSKIASSLNKRLLRFEIDFEMHNANDLELHYEEHDETYLKECIDNLKSKGIAV